MSGGEGHGAHCAHVASAQGIHPAGAKPVAACVGGEWHLNTAAGRLAHETHKTPVRMLPSIFDVQESWLLSAT